MSDDPLSRDFSRFSLEKLRPAIDAVAGRKRSGFLLSVVVAAILFAVFALVVYFMFAPYRTLMSEHSITYWPLLLLVPASLAMIGFTLTYILSLRNTVKDFRGALVERMAEFIDPGLVHEPKRRFSGQELAASLLFPALGKPLPEDEHFRGRAGAAAVDFGDIRVKAAAEGDSTLLSGLFFSARYAREFGTFAMILPAAFPADLSAMEEALRNGGDASGDLVKLENPGDGRQTLVPSSNRRYADAILSPGIRHKLQILRERNGAELHLSFRGDTLYAAILARNGEKDTLGVFEGFDFPRMREFCRDASVCMDLAREIEAQTNVWKNAGGSSS